MGSECEGCMSLNFFLKDWITYEIKTLGRLGGTFCGLGVREMSYKTFAAMRKGEKK